MTKRTAKRTPLSPGKQQVAFLFTNFLYLIFTHFLSLNLYPVGWDFSLLAGVNPGFYRPLVAVDVIPRNLFGENLYGYHLLNLALLYACMVGAFYLAKAVLQGPWWLGSLAAVLVMANPIKNAQVLMLATGPDLAVQALAITSLACYAHYTRNPHWAKLTGSYACFLAAVLLAPTVATLGSVFLVYELTLVRGGWRRMVRVIPLLLPALWHWQLLVEGVTFSMAGLWHVVLTLWMPFYPIGLMPKTFDTLRANPVSWWGLLALIVFCTLAVYQLSRHRAVPALMAAVLVLAFLGGARIGGPDGMQPQGMMLVTLTLMAIAVAAICQQVMQHPKWQRHVVQLTTLLCVLLFAVQIWSIQNWRHAGQQVLALQARTAVTAKAHPGQTLALITDMVFFRGVPLVAHAALAFDTPFSTAYDVQPIFTVPYAQPATHRLTLEAHGLEEIAIRVEARGDGNKPYYPDHWRAGEQYLGTRVETIDTGYRMFATTIPARPFPSVRIPYRLYPEESE